jgi:hypothetical protein
MSLPMSKLVCGMGEAPVTGAWMPMTISSSVIPAVSSGPGSWAAGASSVPPPPAAAPVPSPVATAWSATPLF